MIETSQQMDTEPGKPSGALERGLRILDVLRAATGPMSLKQIAGKIECEPSTTLRLLRTLIGAGYALHDADNKVYLPAPNTLMPLSLYHPLNNFRRDAYSEVSRMREETGLSIAVVLFIRLERLVVEMLYGNERLSPYYETHLKRPVHTSATGKVLLAAIPRDRWPDLLGEAPYTAYTDRSLTTAEDLAADVEKLNTAGYVSTVDESVVGLSGIASPIRNGDGAIVGCVGAFGQTTGLGNPGNHDAIGDQTQRAAALLGMTSFGIQDLAGLVGTGYDAA